MTDKPETLLAAAFSIARDLVAAQRLNLALADRVADQSEFLSRRAERRPVVLTESYDGNYPEG